MEILQKLIENWLIIVIAFILVLLTVYAILRFLKLTPKQQLNKVRTALLYMVTEAEKELKSKTGRVKRSMVWEWLVERFPIISLFITEEKYDELLDQALAEFKKMLENNESLYDYVHNTLTVSETDTAEDIISQPVHTGLKSSLFLPPCIQLRPLPFQTVILCRNPPRHAR